MTQHQKTARSIVRFAAATGALFMSAQAASAQQYITQNVCNNVNGGAIIRTTAFQPLISAGTGLAASTFFGATNTFDAATNTTTCFVPVANVGNNQIMGSLNQAINTAASLSGSNRSIVTIDYTLGASGPNATFSGNVGNSRRFVFMSDGFMANGSTPQNRIPPAGPGPALIVNNAEFFLRGNGEVRGGIVFSGAGSAVHVNFDALDPTTYEDYFVVVNGNIDASAATSAVQLEMMHSRLNGNFTASAHDDTGVMASGAIFTGFVDAGEGNNTLTVKDDAIISGSVLAGDGNNILTIQDDATVSGGVQAGNGNNTALFTGASTVSGDVVFGEGSDTLTISGNTDISGVTSLDGGDDYSGIDTFVDVLNFDGWSGAVNGLNVLHWEQIALKGGAQVGFGPTLRVGAEAGLGLIIENGVVNGGSAFALTGNMQIDADGSFEGFGAGTGIYAINGNLINSGRLATADSRAGDIVTVSGNYSGTGAVFFDTNLEDTTSDTLVITGDVLAGSTILVNANIVGGSATTGDPVRLITVDGTNEGAYSLVGGPITSGVWVYDLQAAQNVDLIAQVNAIGSVYETAPSVLLSGFASLPTLEQRVGQRQWLLRSDDGVAGVWMRAHGERANVTPRVSDSVASWDSSSWGIQVGADMIASENEAGYWVLGATAQYGTVSANITNSLGAGHISSSGYGVGATATWHGYGGTYADIQGQANWISADYSTAANGSLASGRDATAYALSAELGHRFTLDDDRMHALVPQAQLSWGHINGGSFTDSQGNDVNLGTNSRTIGRLGLAYEYRPNGLTQGQRANDEQMVYGIVNILHDFSSASSVDVAGITLQSRGERTWGEIGVGGSVSVAPNAVLYGQASYRQALSGGASGNNSLHGTMGLRFQW